jgi:hypothetical protein
MPRYFFQLPGLSFARPWQLGPTRFLPGAELQTALDTGLTRETTHRSAQAAQVESARLLESWGDDAALEVTADDHGPARLLAEEAVSVLRYLLRRLVRVNVDLHLVGLVGDVREGLREYLTLWDDGSEGPLVAPSFQRIGGMVPFEFGVSHLNAWDLEPSVQLLAGALANGPAGRTVSQQKALDAVTLLDAGRRSLENRARLLCEAIAVETLLSAPRDPTAEPQPQTYSIARRVAYLTCFAGCGRSQEHCEYTVAAKGRKQILQDMERLSRAGEWRCSAYLDIQAPPEVLGALSQPPLFVARNQVAHEGSTEGLTSDALARLSWVVDQATHAALTWYGHHPGKDASDLDAEIDSFEPAQLPDVPSS